MPEICELLRVVLPRVQWSPTVAIAWWEQQRRKAAATACQRRRWLREHPGGPP